MFKIIFYDSRYIDIDHKKNLDEQNIFIIEISGDNPQEHLAENKDLQMREW